jgi:hypothetical protein
MIKRRSSLLRTFFCLNRRWGIRACVVKPRGSSTTFLICLLGNFYGSSAETNMAAIHPSWVWIDHGKNSRKTLRAVLAKKKFVDDRLGFLNGKPTWLSSANSELRIKKALSCLLCNVKYARKFKTAFKILKHLAILLLAHLKWRPWKI